MALLYVGATSEESSHSTSSVVHKGTEFDIRWSKTIRNAWRRTQSRIYTESMDGTSAALLV